MSLISKFLYPILNRIEWWYIGNQKAIEIKGNGDELYLLRCILFKLGPYAVYLHRFFRSDTDDPHDHPFSFLSYVVKGGYFEEKYIKSIIYRDLLFREYAKPVQEGTLNYRKYSTIHRVLLPRNYQKHERTQAPMTLVFVKRKSGTWFFYPEQKDKMIVNTKTSAYRSKVDWKEYLKKKPEKPID